MRDGSERRARALGWFSVGLGLAQLLSPGKLARLAAGADGWQRRRAMRLVGMRELACGLGLLARPRAGWLWTRLAGDVIDLALLGSTLPARRSDPGRVLGSMAGVLAVAALDLRTGLQLRRRAREATGGEVLFTRAITVNRPPEETYRFWRNLENLPRFMFNLQSVQVRDERRSHWIALGPGRSRIEWDAEITADRPGELLSWCSVAGSRFATAGTVRFQRAPAGRGTEIVLQMEYQARRGLFGARLARLLGEEPARKVANDLRRFKQVIETGEVLHSDASIHRGRHPACPPEDRELPRGGGRR